jgi:hypothetical protein
MIERFKAIPEGSFTGQIVRSEEGMQFVRPNRLTSHRKSACDNEKSITRRVRPFVPEQSPKCDHLLDCNQIVDVIEGGPL